MKKRNPIAASLREGQYKPKKVKSKKTYTRKIKHKEKKDAV